MHQMDFFFQAAFDHHNNGNGDEATRQYEAILTLTPYHAETLFHFGLLKHHQGDHDGAVLLICQAIEQQPDNAIFHYNLGVVYQSLHHPDQALACFHQAISLKEAYAMAYFNAGVIYHHRGELASALEAYQHTLRFAPQFIGAYNNCGAILDACGDYDKAIAIYEQALRIKPDNAEILSNLAGVYKNLNRIPEALAYFRKALTLQPDCAYIHSNLLLTLHYHRHETSESILAAHQQWDAQHGQPRASLQRPHATCRDTQKQLHIGYVSGDFKSHPVGFFLLPVLAAHDKVKVKVHGYSVTENTDNITAQMKQLADIWHEATHLNDDELCTLIRDDQIDILVDLSGHTADNRLTVFARKPAPIQASWLGYWSTTGMAAIDYFITDSMHTPSSHEPWFTEKLIRLPNGYTCYAPPQHAQEVTPVTPASRNGFVTFGCFNNSNKLNDDVIELWSYILHATANSRLLLKSQGFGHAEVQAMFTKKFAFCGIDETRLLFEGWSPYHDMLARYAEIDIALDPFPFSGGLTSCDALWMGVPVITYAGPSTVSRQTASYLTQIGLTGCIARDKATYAERALELSKDPLRLSHIRTQLRPRMAASPLCDGKRFTRTLEEAYRRMWVHTPS